MSVSRTCSPSVSNYLEVLVLCEAANFPRMYFKEIFENLQIDKRAYYKQSNTKSGEPLINQLVTDDAPSRQLSRTQRAESIGSLADFSQHASKCTSFRHGILSQILTSVRHQKLSYNSYSGICIMGCQSKASLSAKI